MKSMLAESCIPGASKIHNHVGHSALLNIKMKFADNLRYGLTNLSTCLTRKHQHLLPWICTNPYLTKYGVQKTCYKTNNVVQSRNH